MKIEEFPASFFPGLADPWAALFISFITGIVALFFLRLIANSLLEMHRSKTALRKLRKEYSFWDRFLMLPPWKHSEHAPQFCKVLICIHHIRLCLLLISLLLCLLGLGMENLQTASRILCLISFVMIDIPVIILESLLDRRISWRPTRYEYRFKKYNHTPERRRLW